MVEIMCINGMCVDIEEAKNKVKEYVCEDLMYNDLLDK